MTRREARIEAMQILYNADINNVKIDEIIGNEIIDPMVLEFVSLVENNLKKIDEIISKSLVNYSLNRLNLVDKSIIRLATAEFIKGKVDKKIIINEALEITKEYSDQGDHKATAFNNKLLDNIYKNLNNQ
ncbi:MAG: transcription antitermination protein NusB [Anaeroplasma sp.]